MDGEKKVKEPSFLKAASSIVIACIVNVFVLFLIWRFLFTCSSVGEFSEFGCAFGILYFWFLVVPLASVIVLPLLSILIYKVLNK